MSTRYFKKDRSKCVKFLLSVKYILNSCLTFHKVHLSIVTFLGSFRSKSCFIVEFWTVAVSCVSRLRCYLYKSRSKWKVRSNVTRESLHRSGSRRSSYTVQRHSAVDCAAHWWIQNRSSRSSRRVQYIQ